MTDMGGLAHRKGALPEPMVLGCIRKPLSRRVSSASQQWPLLKVLCPGLLLPGVPEWIPFVMNENCKLK